MLLNKKSLVINVAFILTFISLFLLNNNRQDPSNLIILNSTLSFFTCLFIFIIPIGIFNNLSAKIKRFDVALFLLMFFSVVLVAVYRGYIIVHWVYLLIFYIIVSDRAYNLSYKVRAVFVCAGVISLCLQLLIFDLDGRPVLSYIDSNYSSMMIFLFSVYVYYNFGKIHSIIPFMLGLITLSRAYVLVCLCFLMLEVLIRYNIFRKFMLFLSRPWISLIIIVFLPLLINYIFVLNVSPESAPITTVDEKFSGSLIDRSNLDRSLASILFIEQLVTKPMDYIFGIDIDWYLENIFKNSPHHSFFQMILNYGWLFTIPYVCIFLICCRRICVDEGKILPFYLSFFIYIMTLGGGLFGMTLIFIAFIFKVQNERSEGE